MSILEALAKAGRGAGTAALDALPWQARFWPGDAMREAKGIAGMAPLGAAMGGGAAALSGGDGEQIGRGASPHPDELGPPGYRGRRRNIYGIADADIMGSQTSGTAREAALNRARQMLAEHPQQGR